jgi:hypothetical protein
MRNDEKLLMDEIGERLDAVLFKIEQLLEPDEISLIRWACGKSSYTIKDKNVNFDN